MMSSGRWLTPTCRHCSRGPADYRIERQPKRPRTALARGSMDDYSKASSLDGAEHSPHPNPLGARVDHVVPLGRDFSAQWHVHLVIRPGQLDDLEDALEAAANGDFAAVVAFLYTLPHGDGKETSSQVLRPSKPRSNGGTVSKSHYPPPRASPTCSPARLGHTELVPGIGNSLIHEIGSKFGNHFCTIALEGLVGSL